MNIRIKNIKNIWENYNLGFYCSILGSFAMGTIHLIVTVNNFTYLTLNYMMFCYLLVLIRIFIWLLRNKEKSKLMYLVTAISLILLLIPLGVSLTKTFTDRDKPIYIFDWLVYGYALFAFLKLGFAIKNLIKRKSTGMESNSWVSIVGASFTIFMLEFTLIKTFTNDATSMFPTIIATQIAIIVLTFFIIFFQFFKYFKYKKNNDSNS